MMISGRNFHKIKRDKIYEYLEKKPKCISEWTLHLFIKIRRQAWSNEDLKRGGFEVG